MNEKSPEKFRMGSSANPYGFKYFDKPSTKEDEETEEVDEYGEKYCPDSCCDHDCECDDCVRCADTGLLEPDSYDGEVAAA